ncbi:NUDIX domain-containing protein [Lysinibacillus sp. FSL H8-0500]|uniref:NUDIX domain-containing protein n=1 Tax=Lysinibacillus sp. FSL H8-0500 TaxID=2921393 RepID=UPI003100CC40
MIRNSVKAILIVDNHLLLTKNQDAEGYFYLCPGGGQEHGETFHTTLLRECLEEIGASVVIGELLFIREYIGKNHEHAAFDAHAHQIEYYFLCQLNDITYQPIQPDSHQVGIEWVPLDQLASYRLYPKALILQLQQYRQGQKTAIYLGDVN